MDLNELETLAIVARQLIGDSSWDLRTMNGAEVAPGFFTEYNDRTGQSKTVLYHEESGFVFKHYYQSHRWTASGSYIGEVSWDGVTYQIRLPEFHVFEDVTAQEYIGGEYHNCNGMSSCEHTTMVKDATGYLDSHNGNWKIFNSEIVLFDFD